MLGFQKFKDYDEILKKVENENQQLKEKIERADQEKVC